MEIHGSTSIRKICIDKIWIHGKAINFQVPLPYNFDKHAKLQMTGKMYGKVPSKTREELQLDIIISTDRETEIPVCPTPSSPPSHNSFHTGIHTHLPIYFAEGG